MIGEKIKALIKEKGISKAEVLKKSKISRVGLDNIIKGKTSPTIQMLEKIAFALDKPLSYFFDSSKNQHKGMEINQYFVFVEGSFNTADTRMVCIPHDKYDEVLLAVKSDKDKGWNIPIAKIKLYSGDLLIDAKKAYPDAVKLGEEIVRRWNKEITE